MDGHEFYDFLHQTLIQGQPLHDRKGYTFNQWLHDTDLQFTIPDNNPKAIPQNIIITAKDAFNQGVLIDENWLKRQGYNRGWCPPEVLNYLFEIYAY